MAANVAHPSPSLGFVAKGEMRNVAGCALNYFQKRGTEYYVFSSLLPSIWVLSHVVVHFVYLILKHCLGYHN